MPIFRPIRPARALLIHTALLFALIAAPSAWALNTVWLSAADPAAAGESFGVDLHVDLDEPAIGGGIEIHFDIARLQLAAFSFDPGLGDETAFRCDPSAPTPSCNESLPGTIEVGFARGFFAPDFIGSLVIGTLVFDALAPGAALLSTNPSLGVPGPFSDAFGSPIPIDAWQGTSVQIVPEATTASLLFAGLCAFAALQRRRAGTA